MPEYRCSELPGSRELTAVVWRVAAGLLPGDALPPVVFPVAWKGYRREAITHEYAYSVFVSSFFDESEAVARDEVMRAAGDTACESELCFFLRRFWQESSRCRDEKTGVTDLDMGKVRFRLRRLWMTWQPQRLPDFLEFVRWSARRYISRDAELGWPATPYRPELSPLQRTSGAGRMS